MKLLVVFAMPLLKQTTVFRFNLSNGYRAYILSKTSSYLALRKTEIL